MDALDLLRQDHDQVRSLFEQFKSAKESGDAGRMAQIVAQVITELKVHTSIEEEVFYPQAKEVGGKAEELVAEGVEEHHVVDRLIAEIEQLDPGDDRWTAKVTVMIENVEHHAEEEENELFPQLRDAFGDDRLTRMGEELREAKARHMEGTSSPQVEIDLTDATRDELYEEAKRRNIEGRSDMTKEELAEALRGA